MKKIPIMVILTMLFTTAMSAVDEPRLFAHKSYRVEIEAGTIPAEESTPVPSAELTTTPELTPEPEDDGTVIDTEGEGEVATADPTPNTPTDLETTPTGNLRSDNLSPTNLSPTNLTTEGDEESGTTDDDEIAVDQMSTAEGMEESVIDESVTTPGEAENTENTENTE